MVFNNLCKNLLLFSLSFLSGCSVLPDLWIYNFMENEVELFYASRSDTLGVESGLLLKDLGSIEGESDLYDLRLKIGRKNLCYKFLMPGFSFSNYAQSYQFGKKAIRFRINEDASISVYKVDVKTDFSADREVGIQPEGFPVFPKECDQSES